MNTHGQWELFNVERKAQCDSSQSIAADTP